VVTLACDKPAVIVAGNHDFYSTGPDRRNISDVLKLMRQEADRQNSRASAEIAIILSAEDPVYEMGQIRIVGLTLWSDWAQAGRWMGAANDLQWTARARALANHAKVGPREYGAIRTERGPWNQFDATGEHFRERAILVDELTVTHDGPTVVVTHHPPIADCIDAYRSIAAPWWTPAFYVSDLLPALPVQMHPDLWVCGHVHVPFDTHFGRTRVVCNPVEGGRFDPHLVIEI